jgi:hypothetical protein
VSKAFEQFFDVYGHYRDTNICREIKGAIPAHCKITGVDPVEMESRMFNRMIE